MSDLKQYFESSPKSLNGNAKTKDKTKESWSPDSNLFNKTMKGLMNQDQYKYPIYKRHSNEVGSDKGNQTEFKISSSPFDSDSNLDQDDLSSVKFSDTSNPRPPVDHPYFNRRNGKQEARKLAFSGQRQAPKILKPNQDLPNLKKSNPKTSFDCQPIIQNRTQKIDRNSVPERHYILADSDFVKDWKIKAKRGKKISCVKM